MIIFNSLTQKTSGLFRCFGMILSGLMLVSCSQMVSSMKDSNIRLSESHLLDAGFKIMMADTKERQTMLNSLPPDQITSIPRPDQTYYIFPDPKVCSCLYVGRQAEFNRLQQLAVDSRISSEQLAIHELQQDYQSGWGPMGPWGYGNDGYLGGNNPNGNPAWDPN